MSSRPSLTRGPGMDKACGDERAMPRVSVIIPTYNRRDFVNEAIESVLSQTYRDIELLVVDDASTDGTEEVILSRWPQVRYLRLPHRRGPSAARNLGIAEASGEILTFLDSDDLWLPKKLERQIAHLEAHRNRLVCYTDEIWFRSGKRVNPRRKHHKHSGYIFAHSLRLCIVSPSSVLMRREFFDIVGGFDESFPVCEDYELWLRAACRVPFVFLPEKLIIKRGGHQDQLSRHWGLDVFRVRALLKLLASERLTRRQTSLTWTELSRKTEILRVGFHKHGRQREAAVFAEICQRARQASISWDAGCRLQGEVHSWERQVREIGETIWAEVSGQSDSA